MCTLVYAEAPKHNVLEYENTIQYTNIYLEMSTQSHCIKYFYYTQIKVCGAPRIKEHEPPKYKAHHRACIALKIEKEYGI